MDVTVIFTWSGVTGLFIVYLTLLAIERRRGARFGVTNFRSWCDRYLLSCERRLGVTWRHFTRYILQLHWHYWIHRWYRSVLLSLQALYAWFEQRFEKNRARAKSLRAEKRRAQTNDSHLQEVVAHKTAHALTAAQKRSLKKKSIEPY